MSEGHELPQVGAQDPELKNSPVAEEMDEDSRYLREEVPGEPVCFFNGEAYDDGALVKSGESVLRCDRGIWVDVGEGIV
jgi:hypothetical protein